MLSSNHHATPGEGFSHHFHASILRAYDIRGIVGETLFLADAYAIGRCFASIVAKRTGEKMPKIALAYDGRLSSPELQQALAEGMRDAGAAVHRYGCGPTPMLYFAVCDEKLDAGIMLTGSHNPPSHNGFKMMLGQKSFFGEDIQELGRVAAAGDVLTAAGSIQDGSVTAAFIDALAAAFEGKGAPLNAVWDPGNGATGEIVSALVKRLPGAHTVINAEIDGTFPNHHPDPTVPENLKQLVVKVAEMDADIGLAFDGDGDRLGAVDRRGNILFGDQLMMLFARDVLADFPGATIIADVKASQSLFDEIALRGGQPLMWKTGHSFMKDKIAETGAKLAGEMSGHIFFKDRYYGFDDGIYAAVRLLNLLAKADAPLEALLDALPKAVNTPEIRVDVAEEEKFALVERIKTVLAGSNADVNDVDGVRVTTEEGWWLARASNTQAAVIVRVEAKDAAALVALKQQAQAVISAAGGAEVAALKA